MAISSITISGTAVSCAHCLSLLVKGLRQEDGVISVSADKKTDVLVVEFDSSVSDEHKIRLRLRVLGFAGDELYCLC